MSGPVCAEWADKLVYSDDVSAWVWVSTHVERLMLVITIETLVIVVLLWWIGATWKRGY